MWPAAAAAQGTSYVATNGSDTTGNGTFANPWATISRALNDPNTGQPSVPDSSTILVRPGTYNGPVSLRGVFANGVVVRSEVPYQARLRHTATVVTCFYGKGITLDGFDIAHSGPGAGALVIQIQDLLGPEPGGSDFVSRIVIRNNVLHDSHNNDILKINNGAGNVTVEGNVFYNQTGSDEHIDVNSVTDVVIQDNVFFNDFAGSGRSNANDTSSYIVIKDSNAGDDTNLGSLRITVRRNVFLNWEGSSGANFVLLGEDGQPFYEARDVLVENNLMLGNAGNVMRAAFGVKGSRDATFRHNTVVGDLPSLAFAMRLNREGGNPVVENVRFHNNVWSDPTGTMEDFSDTPPADLGSFALSRNLYWNGGSALPLDSAERVNYTDDATRIVANPLLPSLSGIVLPRWNSATGLFADGSKTVRQAFERLVALYGQPAPGSQLIDAAEATQKPADDILGTPRTGSSDIGAVESSAGHALRFFGNGVAAPDLDRVKIRIDDPANALPGPPVDVGAGDFTIELWLKALAAENTAAAVSCGANIAWINGNIVIDRDRYNQQRKFGLSIAGGTLVWGVSTDAGDRTICGATPVTDGAWHHVALQRRRSDGALWMYVDGVLDASASGAQGPDGDLSYPDDGVPGNFCGGPCTNSDPFIVLAAEKHDAGSAYPSFSGWMDELRFSDVLRYAAPFARPTTPFTTDASTVGLYRFNEGAGDVVGDSAAAIGGPSTGARRFGGSPAGPLWVVSDAPLGGGGATQTVSVAFSAAAGSVAEGAGTGSASVVLTTSDGSVSAAPASVQFSAAGGTATAGTDYTLGPGTLNFAAGTASGASQPIVFAVSIDTTDEPNETFNISLASPAGATLGTPAAHTVTIVDDDPPAGPSVTATPASLQANGAVTVTVAGGPANARDWVGLYATTANDFQILDWKYLSGSRTPPSAGSSSATLAFAMPGAAGSYEFRLFANDSYQRLANSQLVTVQASSVTLTATPATVSAGGAASVAIAGGPGNARDWVGVYAVGASDLQLLDWKYLNGSRTPPASGLTHANVGFAMPFTAGSFEFRLFENDSYARRATSNTVTVQASTALLAATPSTIGSGGTVGVAVTGGPGGARDWVGLYAAGTTDVQILDWKYLNGQRTPPANGLTTATLAFAMPSTLGSYQFRLFSNDGYQRLATSNTVNVQAANPTLTPATASAAPGQPLAVTLAGGPGGTTDWIALYAVSANDAQFFDWLYLNGSKTPPAAGLTAATLTFTMPATPGSYNFRLFANNSFTRLATSGTVNVQ